MWESDTYQAIIEEGRVEAGQHIVLRLGRKRFGEPDAVTEAALKAITDPDRLEQLSERLLDVASWQDLLRAP